MLERLGNFNVSVYFADCWEAYRESMPQEMLVQAKAETHGIERNDFRRRRRCGRFRRRACMVSRCLLMLDLTIFLFARFHVNGTREEILQLCYHPF